MDSSKPPRRFTSAAIWVEVTICSKAPESTSFSLALAPEYTIIERRVSYRGGLSCENTTAITAVISIDATTMIVWFRESRSERRSWSSPRAAMTLSSYGIGVMTHRFWESRGEKDECTGRIADDLTRPISAQGSISPRVADVMGSLVKKRRKRMRKKKHKKLLRRTRHQRRARGK